MTGQGFRAVDERLVHQGAVVGFHVGTFEGPDGTTFERDVVRHPGAVGVVALDDDGRVVLVRQYRAAIDADLLELPAGKLDVGGEDPAATAQRELVEEVGLEAGRWTPLVALHNSPGFCDEVVHLFLAEDLREVDDDRQGVEEQAMTVERTSLAGAPARIAAGEITDAKTIIGIFTAVEHLRRRCGG